MSVLDRDTFLARVRDRIGEATDDDSISFLEDMTDTYESLTANGQEDWKAKYEENDKQWRERYRNRFMDKVEDIKDDVEKDQKDEMEERANNLRIEDLFS